MLYIEVLANVLSPGSPEALRSCWVGKQPRNTLSEGFNISAFYNITGFTIEDGLSDTTAWRRNNGPFTAHGLQKILLCLVKVTHQLYHRCLPPGWISGGH